MKARVILNFSSKGCLKEFIGFLKILAENNNLKRLLIHQAPYGFEKPSNRLLKQCLNRFIKDNVISQLKKCLSKLDEFSIGCVPELSPCLVDELLESLNPSVKILGLASLKRSSSKFTFDPTHLLRFQKLQVLHIELCQLSGKLLDVLNEIEPLKKIIIHSSKMNDNEYNDFVQDAVETFKNDVTIVIRFK
ncbi:uncharacterized protein [Leptinotarsa decemlineata]|uniref:uncharacterized protein n=1 Tax=Leptinotarsa decemlineata TaxID=7539 RepID=UPI003D304E93